MLLAFFKITCPVCQFTFPYLERLQQAGSLPVFGVSQNDAEDTAEFNREFKLTMPMLLDLEEDGFPASNAFGISNVPTLFVVAADGTIERVVEGWSKQDMEGLGRLAGTTVFRPGDNVPAWKAG